MLALLGINQQTGVGLPLLLKHFTKWINKLATVVFGRIMRCRDHASDGFALETN